jgi:ATP-dependent helicase/nuclease subunit A
VHVIIDDQAGETVVGSALFAKMGASGEPQVRGKLIHRLLQALPDFAADERAAAAERYLLRAVPDLPADNRHALAGKVVAILGDPRFAALHAGDSQAEVSIMGTVTVSGQNYAVSGRIDRLGSTDDEVFILDYKTNLRPPLSETDIPFAHKAQLALYREVLKPIFPGKTVNCLLIYTEGPHLYALSEAELEKALLAIARQ